MRNFNHASPKPCVAVASPNLPSPTFINSLLVQYNDQNKEESLQISSHPLKPEPTRIEKKAASPNPKTIKAREFPAWFHRIKKLYLESGAKWFRRRYIWIEDSGEGILSVCQRRRNGRHLFWRGRGQWCPTISQWECCAIPLQREERKLDLLWWTTREMFLLPSFLDLSIYAILFSYRLYILKKKIYLLVGILRLWEGDGFLRACCAVGCHKSQNHIKMVHQKEKCYCNMSKIIISKLRAGFEPTPTNGIDG